MRYLLPHILKLSTNNEGGYSNHPKDPGGPTNHGITLATLRAFRKTNVGIPEVKALTLAEADRIYEANYWRPIWGDKLPAGLDYAVFDFGINSGPSRAIRVLQAMLPGCAVDGVMGGKTLSLIMAQDIALLTKNYCAERMKYFRKLGTWKTFGRGWTYRVTGLDPKGVYPRRKGVVGDALAMQQQRPVTFLPFPLDDLMPLAKGRDVDVKITAPLGNKIQIGGILAGASGISIKGAVDYLPTFTQAAGYLEQYKDVASVISWVFITLVLLCAVLTIMHNTQNIRQSGVNT